jgi:hypothetical protein
MYHNHIPHNHRPLEDLLNGNMQLGHSRHPQRAGLRWAGHDAQPETIVRITEVCDSFILTWTDLFQIGTPRELGLADLLSRYIKPGKQYEYRMDFRFPDAVYLVEKGSPDALMVDLDGSIVHAPDMPKIIKAVNVIANYQAEYELFLWAGGIDTQANDATFVSPNALSASRLRTLLTEDVSLAALLISQIRDYHELQLGYDDTSAWLSRSGKRPRPRTNPTGLYLPSKARSSVLLTVGPKGSGAGPAYKGEFGRPTYFAERILKDGLDLAVNGQYGNRFSL